MASDTAASSQTMSGLSEKEAQEFHSIFVVSFSIFAAVATAAHLLVWLWRPWIPGPEGYASLTDMTVNSPLTMLLG